MKNPYLKFIIIVLTFVIVMSFWYVRYVSSQVVTNHVDGWYRVEVDDETYTISLFTNYPQVLINGKKINGD